MIYKVPLLQFMKVALKDQADSDGDKVGDVCDNCAVFKNTDQFNHDNDSMGDACDQDIDDDSIPNDADNCPKIANKGQPIRALYCQSQPITALYCQRSARLRQ